MSDWLDQIPEAATNYLEGQRLDEVECLIPDLSGIARGKAMPGSKFATQPHFYLPNSIFFQTITGDWGEVGQEDGAENAFSVREGFRLLSAYATKEGEKLWIITERDRSVTTILLPGEYESVPFINGSNRTNGGKVS